MIIFKLIVLFCYVHSFSAISVDFCKICLNHTLCKYKTQGPSPSCKSYDSSALLTSQDIIELVNKINERRNFVAMGHSRFLPQAADMKKVKWSNLLAISAQRWADQCDPSIRPDKEDQCRDLKNLSVGQNIASVLGTSPGLSVKGFVEMWFIEVLDFTGSVTYYNKSTDTKTNSFTQLIWAKTEFVGCGASKFYVDERHAMLERLVCNFAPRGNLHGKPVYSIGFPGTQCEDKMIPDKRYKGLCSYQDDATITKLTSQRRPVNSLLKILNLSNDSVKQDIDPIRNNFKHNSNNHSSNQKRNQKTRHILLNRTYGAIKQVPQLRKQLNAHSYINFSQNNNEYHYPHERGHSHLYHGHGPLRHTYEMTTISNTNQDYRRYDYTTLSMNLYFSTNYRRFNQKLQCTRKISPIQDSCSNQCTRAPESCCHLMTTCPSTCADMFCMQPEKDHPCPPSLITPRETCAHTQQTCPPASTNCNHNVNCPCSIPCTTNTCFLKTTCPGAILQNNDFNDYRRAGIYQYYDMIPNAILRSGNQNVQENKSPNDSLSHNWNYNRSYKLIGGARVNDQVPKAMTEYQKHKPDELDYLYHSFDSDLRKKRQLENQMEVKPFWQIENFSHNLPQLKSMRFTTLLNNNNRKTSVKWLTSMEPITQRSTDYDVVQPDHVTEKYLSFDELMHLRKNSDEYAQYNLRRGGNLRQKGKAAPAKPKAAPAKPKAAAAKPKAAPAKKADKPTTKTDKTTKKADVTTKSTSEYTINTPFERVKHCTRKITCTWTMIQMGGNDGDGKNGKINIGMEVGSRTPPGYVEGCTRTSTCTRDFQDRNKAPTSSDEHSSDAPEDEDYCERRSLNVRRRNSDTKTSTDPLLRYLHHTTTATEVASTPVSYSYSESVTKSSKAHNCICEEGKRREKREALRRSQDIKYCQTKSSFLCGSDICDVLLNKIRTPNHEINSIDYACSCNSAITLGPFAVLCFLKLLLLYCHYK
ncbi:uncharacterized protein LOC110374135 [Helicoverpa armigera]|uniref:uncharacterized protein LOC110374135 n=1 Tax=Helicoverpa armigera TaxID=29058 RepID=UPI0030834AEC